MSKKIAIQIKDALNLEFTLNEDAKKGDYICVNDINEVNLEETKKFIANEIEKQKELLINQLRNKEKENWINGFKNSNEFLNLKEENIKLKNNLDQLLKNKELEIKSFYDDKINDLNYIINDLKSKQELIEIKNEKEIEIVKNELNAKYLKDIEFYKIKIEELQRNKKFNIKIIGNEFENWIYSEMQKHFSFYSDVKFEKITKNIDGEKADFLFEISHDGAIVDNVVIEAKTAENTGTTKNSNHFAKLNRAYNHNNSSFAILVTELEPDDEFSIRKINEYENMYMVRPQFLHIMLDLMRIVMIQKNIIRNKTISFKDQEKILQEFEEFKDAIINNSLKHITKNIEDIIKQAESINKASQKILESGNIIISKHLKTIANKFENYNIENKIIKKIKNINDDEIKSNEEELIIKRNF